MLPHLNWAVVVLGHFLGLEVGLEVAVQQVVDKLLQVVHGELVLHDVFLVGGIAGSHNRLVSIRSTKLLKLVSELIRVGNGEEDLLTGIHQLLTDLHDSGRTIK